jgi:hypothetical protein
VFVVAVGEGASDENVHVMAILPDFGHADAQCGLSTTAFPLVHRYL